jgi:hypothetical protein
MQLFSIQRALKWVMSVSIRFDRYSLCLLFAVGDEIDFHPVSEQARPSFRRLFRPSMNPTNDPDERSSDTSVSAFLPPQSEYDVSKSDPLDAATRPSILFTVAGFIVVTEFCERVAYYGFAGSLVLFFQVK